MSETPKGLKGSDHAVIAVCDQPGSTSIPSYSQVKHLGNCQQIWGHAWTSSVHVLPPRVCRHETYGNEQMELFHPENVFNLGLLSEDLLMCLIGMLRVKENSTKWNFPGKVGMTK